MDLYSRSETQNAHNFIDYYKQPVSQDALYKWSTCSMLDIEKMLGVRSEIKTQK